MATVNSIGNDSALVPRAADVQRQEQNARDVEPVEQPEAGEGTEDGSRVDATSVAAPINPPNDVEQTELQLRDDDTDVTQPAAEAPPDPQGEDAGETIGFNIDTRA